MLGKAVLSCVKPLICKEIYEVVPAMSARIRKPEILWSDDLSVGSRIKRFLNF